MPSLRETVDKTDNNSISTLLVAGYLDKNTLIQSIEPFYFEGSTSALINTFVPGRIYFIIDFKAFPSPVVALLATIPKVSIYNHLGALSYVEYNNAPVYNVITSATDFVPLIIKLDNVIFGRVTDISYDYYSLNGYKLAITP